MKIPSNTPLLASNPPTATFHGGEDYFELYGTMLATRSAANAFNSSPLGIKCHLANGINCYRIEPVNRGRFQYPVALWFRDCTLAIRPDPDSTGVSFWSFTAPGQSCLRHGARELLLSARSILASQNCIIEEEKLSRVDVCLDLPGVSMDPFVKAVREERYIMRSRHCREIESFSQTVILGKEPLSLSIYDRLAFVNSKLNRRELLDLMKQRRWGGMVPREAVRVEFRLRRAALTRLGIDSPDDYFDRRGDIVAHLCDSAFRFAENPVDRSNTARAKVLPLWQDVARGFARWAGQPQGVALQPLPKQPADVSHLMKQAYGLVRRIAIQLERNPVTLQEFEIIIQKQCTQI